MADGGSKAVSLIFRIAALGLSVAAAVVMATASQLVIVHGAGSGNADRGPLSSYDATVSYSHYSALRYFVAASAISAVCSAAALYLCAVRRTDAAVGSLSLVPLLDAAAQGLLFSAAGAAFAARGVLAGGAGAAAPWGWGYGGGGGGVCGAAGAFCGKVTIAAVLGAGAGAAVAAAGAALTSDAAHRGGGGGSSSSSFCHS